MQGGISVVDWLNLLVNLFGIRLNRANVYSYVKLPKCNFKGASCKTAEKWTACSSFWPTPNFAECPFNTRKTKFYQCSDRMCHVSFWASWFPCSPRTIHHHAMHQTATTTGSTAVKITSHLWIATYSKTNLKWSANDRQMNCITSVQACKRPHWRNHTEENRNTTNHVWRFQHNWNFPVNVLILQFFFLKIWHKQSNWLDSSALCCSVSPQPLFCVYTVLCRGQSHKHCASRQKLQQLCLSTTGRSKYQCRIYDGQEWTDALFNMKKIPASHPGVMSCCVNMVLSS